MFGILDDDKTWVRSKKIFAAIFLVVIELNSLQASLPLVLQDQDMKDSLFIEEYLDKYVRAMDFSGTILVAAKGVIIHHKSYGTAIKEWDIPNTNNSKYQIASISKPMTACLVLRLAEEGRLSLDDKISEYLPDFPKEKGDSISIHQLLTHTGGIGHYQDAPEIEAWKERLALTKEELIKLYGEMPLVARPGSKYYYSSFGYNLLAYTCEAATGNSFPRLMKEYVFDPAGMQNSRLASESDIISGLAKGYDDTQFEGLINTTYLHPNICLGSGDVICTAEDLYKFSVFMIYSDKLTKAIRDLVFRQHVSSGTGFYGYGWIMGKSAIAGCDYISHGGKQNGYQSELWHYKDHDLTVIILSNIRTQEWDWGNDPSRPGIAGLRNSVVRILLHQPVEAPKRSIAKEFAGWIRSQGVDAALERYRELRKDIPEGSYLSEIEINMLGYNFYSKRKDFITSEKILMQNVSDYPDSYNVYDSMGWLYRQLGELEQARNWYLKGLLVYEKYREKNQRWIRDVESAKKWLESFPSST